MGRVGLWAAQQHSNAVQSGALLGFAEACQTSCLPLHPGPLPHSSTRYYHPLQLSTNTASLQAASPVAVLRLRHQNLLKHLCKNGMRNGNFNANGSLGASQSAKAPCLRAQRQPARHASMIRHADASIHPSMHPPTRDSPLPPTLCSGRLEVRHKVAAAAVAPLLPLLEHKHDALRAGGLRAGAGQGRMGLVGGGGDSATCCCA